MNKYNVVLVYKEFDVNCASLVEATSKINAINKVLVEFSWYVVSLKRIEELKTILKTYGYSIDSFDFANFEGVAIELAEDTDNGQQQAN